MGLTGTEPACDHLHACLLQTLQVFVPFHPICYLPRFPQPATADAFKSEGSVMHLSEASHVCCPHPAAITRAQRVKNRFR